MTVTQPPRPRARRRAGRDVRTIEFLPPDPTLEPPYRLTPARAVRISILGLLVLVTFALLFLRLWSLQILRGEEMRAAAIANQVRVTRVEAPRGPILDRNGRVLVSNAAVLRVELWPGEGEPTALPRLVNRLARALEVPKKRLAAAVAKAAHAPLAPVVVTADATAAEVSYLLERQDEFPGVRVASGYARRFEQGILAAQVLGYLGEITDKQLVQRKQGGYVAGDRIGQTGVEAAYDRYLRGVAGVAIQPVDALGRPRAPQRIRTAPEPGNALRLTIDADLQRAAEQALRSSIALARRNENWAANGGAIVAMDPQNGEILAMASNPTFDPDVYTAPVDPAALRWLARPGANAPTLNRATQGLYPPGSTFKPVTALAAVAEDVLSPYEYVHCGPSMLVNGQRFRNWNPNVNTPMALETAIASSCDTYFYSVGLRFYDLPPERGSPLQRWAHRFGIGRPTGTDLGHEEAGLLPTPKWRKSHFRSPIDRLWKPGDSIQLAIGQGDLLVTPLQMTRFYAMIANGGRLVTPHVAQQLERSGGGARAGQVLQRFAPPRPDAVALNPAALAALRRGLVEATHAQYGTSAGVFAGFPVVVAGKTGTAEKFISVPGYKGLADQAWWCGYAPADDPRLVVCAVIENGGFGGEAAAPAALRVFERFFRVRAKLVRPADYD